MNCRMLVCAGKLPMTQILDDFKLMVLNKNEKHEINKEKPHLVHGDGWGIVIGRFGKLGFYKKAVSCLEDPKYKEYYQVDANFLILHARKATPNMSISYSFTHPFEKDGWFFCHNGTIYDLTGQRDRSDSERFFEIILDAMNDGTEVINAIKVALSKVKCFSAINFILANSSKAYVLNKFQEEYPQYFTMKYLVTEDYVMVSSERLQHFDGAWEVLGNNNLAVLDIRSRRLECHSLNL
jgi:predicted glutamine amidotransferase